MTTVRREIIPSGKSRAFINDTPVNLETLQKISYELIDIHSQFQNHFIIKEEYQIDILDLLAKNQNLIEKYNLNFFSFKELKNKIDKLEASRFNMNQEKDYNTHLLNEIRAIDVSESVDSIEQKFNQLSNSEEINTTFNQILKEEKEIQLELQTKNSEMEKEKEKLHQQVRSLTNSLEENKKEYHRFQSVEKTLGNELDSMKNLMGEKEKKIEWLTEINEKDSQQTNKLTKEVLNVVQLTLNKFFSDFSLS